MLLLVVGIALTFPKVQTKMAHYFVEKLNEQYGISINVDEVAITIYGGVKLKKVFISDYKNDTLLYSKTIYTNILDAKKLLDGDLLFGDLKIDGLVFKMINYKGEKENNLDKFIAKLDDGKPNLTGKRTIFKANKVSIANSRFVMFDYNRQVPKDLDLKQWNAEVKDFKLYGSDIDANIVKMSCLDHRGLFVDDLSSKFLYTKKNIKLKDLAFLTKQSAFKGDIIMSYERKDFADFNNKVLFDIKIDSASLASNDIYHFYKDLGKDQVFKIKSKLKGTLNDIYFTNLDLSDKKNTRIIGDINFKNLFGKPEKGQEFYMKGKFDKVSSNYDNLASILPNVLGKKLPTSLKKLGQFNIIGESEITTKTIVADIYMTSALGNVKSNLSMSNINNIDNANYSGDISLQNFDIGTFLNRKDVGKVTMTMDVEGKGFTEKYLKTNFSGKIDKIRYNNYDYSNVVVNGNFKKPIFVGKILVRDPNLIMDFDGIVDLSQKTNRYIFDTKIDFADLKSLNFINDSISKFNGNIKINATGTNIDNFVGQVNVTQSAYQNKKTTYNFEDFEIISSFDAENIRNIKVNSPDIIEGEIVGKFKFDQLSNMLQNAVGSLYTNYKPNKVAKGQYLKFDFGIYNKIIEIFYPGIEIATNTKIHGSINSDNDEFKFKFNSPQIAAFDNYFDNLRIEIDNKNPLFNTYIELDSIRTKQYKIRDFSLINITQSDTLHVRSEFKGGNNGEDNYNLNLFHTINNENNNVVGIQKSEVKFKENVWLINENENKHNTIIFNKKLENFIFDDIKMSHENQSISLFGNLQNKTNKDITLSFNDVDLTKISPALEKFKIEGILNGDMNILQKDNIYQPTADVNIDLLKINAIDLGKLNLDISGDDSLSKFNIDSNLENKNLQAFSAKGNVAIKNEKTFIDLDLNFDKFNLGILSSIGGTTITNIKGLASGNAKIEGNVNDFDMNGRLYLDNAGLNVPYLNVNFGFDNQSVVDVSKTKFIIRNAKIFDTKENTNGILKGSIQHKNFTDWKLDLNIESDNLLVLDTEVSDDAMYFGKAFIFGNANIKGPVSGLFINVEAKSNKGTDIKIPINDGESVGEKSYIHFITEKEKFKSKSGFNEVSRNYEGLELNFDLDITPDANIEIIIDKDNGHIMKGKGYGNLNMAINTLGKFNMTGNFQVIEGKYDFRYGGIIDKTFDVKKFGTIVWTGDPLKADLNLEAVYKTTANPGVLLENPSFNQKVDVDVIIGVKGNLSNPDPDFNIDFPKVSSILKSEIQTKLDDKDLRQKQALYLLSAGSFLSAEGLDQSAITSNILERASGLIDDLFQDKDSKIKFNVMYNEADRARNLDNTNNNGGRFDLNLTTKINDRISINGRFGVPVGGVTQTAIIGNVEFLYRVNEDGTLNLRFFNRENEINYIGEGLGYTQGGGISYEVDFDKFTELVNKIFRNKKTKIIQNPLIYQSSDSDVLPINKDSQKDKNNSKDESKPFNDAIPKEDD